jgi:hypothetical protein
VTYGHWLDQARDALRAAGHTAAEGRADGHADAAATIAARNRVYRQLVRLTDHIGRPITRPISTAIADQLVNSTRRLATTTPAKLLGVGLRAATTDFPAIADATAGRPGPVARQLSSAADAIGLAADILSSHLGPPRSRPRTPEGQALAARAGQRGALADISRLTTDAIDVDRRLAGWLSRGRPARTLKPVYRPVTDRLRWWTRGHYPTVLHDIAGQHSGESVLRLLDVAPATERSTGARQVASPHDVVAVLDTARAWLQQQPSQAQLVHVRALTRLAATITQGASALGPETVGTAEGGAYAHRWHQIARKLQNVVGLDDRPDQLVREVVAATDWLHEQFQAQVVTRRQTGAVPEEWRTGVSTMLGRLPTLAGQLDLAVIAAVSRGELCVPQHELDLSAPKRGVFHAKAGWRKALLGDDQVRILRHHLVGAAKIPPDREQALRQALGDPAALARLSYSAPPSPTETSSMPPDPTRPERSARRRMTR